MLINGLTEGEYKIIRRFNPGTDARISGIPAINPRVFLCLDTETTGLNYLSDKIIELALIAVEYEAATGQITRVLDMYESFEDPGVPIPSEATAVNGITDDMVKGKKFDDARVAEMIGKAHIIVAHNSKFDRKFLEERFPVFASKPWACTLTQIDWAGELMNTRSLEFLLYKMGFFVDAHRALADTQGVVAVLLGTLPVSGELSASAMLAKARAKSWRIYAVDAPFEAKDTLRCRGYTWFTGGDGKSKSWFKDVTDKEAELEWMAAEIYYPGADVASIPAYEVDAYSRFSVREP